ncbi:retrovirus-related pol polyprotein from transposon TNT 1-94 [Tanacetum coccineum]
MANLSEDIQCAGSDTRPPMLDKADFVSWQINVLDYTVGLDNGDKLLKSLMKDHFQMGTTTQEIIEEGTEGPIQSSEKLHSTQASTELRKLKDKNVANAISKKMGNLGEEQSLCFQADDLWCLRTLSRLPVVIIMRTRDARTMALTKEVKEMSDAFDELEAELDQSTVDRKHDAIGTDRSNESSLQGKDNVIQKLKMQISQFQETHSELDRPLDLRGRDFQISQLTEEVYSLQEQNELFRAENAKIKQHYKELYDSIKITRAKHTEQTTALKSENESLKVQIQNTVSCVTTTQFKPKVTAPGKYALDVEPIPPRNRNNREVHLVYLRHLKESVDTLRDIVEEAKAERPLDRSLEFACRYTKHSQELLEYVFGTCPKVFNQQDKKHATTPRKKQVAFEDQIATSSSTTHKHVEPRYTQKSNVPVPPSTGVSCCTDASGSQPRSILKKHRIPPAKSDSLKKVEDHSRLISSSLRTTNRVDSSISSKRTVINSPSQSVAKHLVHDKKPDLTFFRVFGALCYPTNDSENLGKLQPTADIGIFVGYAPNRKGYRIYNKRTRQIMETIHVTFDELTEQMAPVQFSSGPAPILLTPGPISSGLVPNPAPAIPIAPPTNKELEMLFQPMFDEYFNPPGIHQNPIPVIPTAGEPSAEVNPFAAADPEPFVNEFAPDNNSEASSSGEINIPESSQSTQHHEHVRKWTDSHPIDNIIGNPSRPVSTRKQLATDALWCFYNSVLSKVEPKNFQSAATEDCWFQAMQDEIHEFDRLDVWELVPPPDSAMIIVGGQPAYTQPSWWRCWWLPWGTATWGYVDDVGTWVWWWFAEVAGKPCGLLRGGRMATGGVGWLWVSRGRRRAHGDRDRSSTRRMLELAGKIPAGKSFRAGVLARQAAGACARPAAGGRGEGEDYNYMYVCIMKWK